MSRDRLFYTSQLVVDLGISEASSDERGYIPPSGLESALLWGDHWMIFLPGGHPPSSQGGWWIFF